MLLCGVLLFLLPIKLDRRGLTLSILFKYPVLLFSLQPFVHEPHGRYYVQYVPYIAMAIAVTTANRGRVLLTRRAANADEWLVLCGQIFALAFGATILTATVVLG